jgi:hypothetical protein
VFNKFVARLQSLVRGEKQIQLRDGTKIVDEDFHHERANKAAKFSLYFSFISSNDLNSSTSKRRKEINKKRDGSARVHLSLISSTF